MASQERSMPFIKNLASSDRKTRTAALDSLRTFLSSKAIASKLSTLDTLKLWKGLFYALWMCDRPLPQQQLCADLAGLVWVLPRTTEEDSSNSNNAAAAAAVPAWLRAFWATMAREWTTGIDVLRMEKFLLLVRRMLGASLVWMQVREGEEEQEETTKTNKKSSNSKKRTASGASKSAAGKGQGQGQGPSGLRYDAQRVEAVLTLLADWPFRPDEESRHEEEEDDLMPKAVPVGLKLHVLDIWVDEADKAGLLLGGEDDEQQQQEEEDDDKKTKKKKQVKQNTLSGREVLQRINGLVDTLNTQTLSKAVRIRSKESLADDRLPWNEKAAEAEDGEGEWGGLDD